MKIAIMYSHPHIYEWPYRELFVCNVFTTLCRLRVSKNLAYHYQAPRIRIMFDYLMATWHSQHSEIGFCSDYCILSSLWALLTQHIFQRWFNYLTISFSANNNWRKAQIHFKDATLHWQVSWTTFWWRMSLKMPLDCWLSSASVLNSSPLLQVTSDWFKYPRSLGGSATLPSSLRELPCATDQCPPVPGLRAL